MDKYKVVIVDDDELALDNLIFGLQKFEDFYLSGIARNDVSAKRLILASRSRFGSRTATWSTPTSPILRASS